MLLRRWSGDQGRKTHRDQDVMSHNVNESNGAFRRRAGTTGRSPGPGSRAIRLRQILVIQVRNIENPTSPIVSSPSPCSRRSDTRPRRRHLIELWHLSQTGKVSGERRAVQQHRRGCHPGRTRLAPLPAEGPGVGHIQGDGGAPRRDHGRRLHRLLAGHHPAVRLRRHVGDARALPARDPHRLRDLLQHQQLRAAGRQARSAAPVELLRALGAARRLGGERRLLRPAADDAGVAAVGRPLLARTRHRYRRTCCSASSRSTASQRA